MSAHRRILLAGLPLALAVTLTAPAQALTLRLRIVNASDASPSAARLQILDPNGPLFEAPDPELRTHLDAAGDPYLYAEDFVDLELPAGEYRIRSYAGPTSIPRETVVLLDQDREQLVEVEHWIDPREWGWYCADPHVHLSHSNDPTAPNEYSGSSTQDAGRAGRAEGLDVMYLLENDPDHTRGLVYPHEPGISVCWGEEFRSGFWGHLVILNEWNLVTVAGNPWANGPGLPAWPMLRKVLEDNAPPLAYLAHPITADPSLYNQGWPSTGYGRELPSLIDLPELHGIAVGSGSNGPWSAWQLTPLREGLAAGAEWAVFGETDAVLDRHLMRPVGSPRTYARLNKSPAPGSDSMERQWRRKARDARSYATDGPLLLEFGLGGASVGETVTSPDEFNLLSVHLLSWTPLRRVTLRGSSGRNVDIPIAPQSVYELDVSMQVEFAADELVFLEAVADGGSWYAQEDSLRLVSSPVHIVRGLASITPPEWARRNADGMGELWKDSLLFRGYESEDDSSAARGVLDQAMATWESLCDDPPGEFSLVWPWEGREVGSRGLQLVWTAARSYDLEEIRYELELDASPDFPDPQTYTAIPDTFHFLGDALDPGHYWWRVRAYEPDGDSTWMNESGPDFTVVPDAVSTTPMGENVFRLSQPHRMGGGMRAFLEISRDADVRFRWFDARGRLVFQSGREPMNSGRHALFWDGKDRQGREVASGVYWLVADAAGRRSVRSAVLLEP